MASLLRFPAAAGHAVRPDRSNDSPWRDVYMAAAGTQDDRWIEQRRRREERMRYEVLLRLYQAADRCSDLQISAGNLVDELGVWRAEFYRVIEYLDRRGYIRYLGGGPVVCLTRTGIDYIEREACRRKSIRHVGE